MKIQQYCFGGKIGFQLRKKFPNLTSNLFLNVQRKKSNKIIKKYFDTQDISNLKPLFVSIETINRCNGTCPFCPCNIREETRPFYEMPDKIFKKIIKDLKKIDYSETLMLLANNEILLDKNILERLQYARKMLPKAHMKMFTNGKLLTPKIFQYILDNNLIDEMIINNYNSSSNLTKPIKKIWDMYKNKNINTKVIINIRYANEVLSNRANSSPNKKGNKIVKDYCALPFTDININPYGNLLICCCDAKEETNLGNIMDNDILTLFNNEKYINLRKKMKHGRNNINFCKYCDFNDMDTRKTLMLNKMRRKR